MEDIEDLSPPIADPTSQRLSQQQRVTIHRRAKRRAEEAPVSTRTEGHAYDHFLPGTSKIWVKTWGCGHNVSDGEYMAGLLASQGYDVLMEDAQKDEADLWLLNSCTVKGPSEMSFINDLRKGSSSGKKVVVAGCVPQGSTSEKGTAWTDFSIVGVQQIDRVVEAVEETLKGNVVHLTKEKKVEAEGGGRRKAGGASLDLPKMRRNDLVEIIPINTGCLNQCTYCKTKHARGNLGSYAPEEIWSRVESVLSEGVKEIWLTSEDTGAYGIDIGVNIVYLLWGIVDRMEKHHNQDAMLRVGMTNPPYILEHLEEISKILAHPRVYSFLHVPVQAGSDKVLNDMKRLYLCSDFCLVVDTLRSSVPGCTIATDVICGFPTEDDSDWLETMNLLRRYKFPVLHISQFYPRPGTPAAKMPLLRSDVVKDRSRAATALFGSYFPYAGMEGAELRVLVTEVSSDGEHYVGHDKSYRQVLVTLDSRYLGRWLRVRVTRTGKFFLEGEVLEVEEPAEAEPELVVRTRAGPKRRVVGGRLVRKAEPEPRSAGPWWKGTGSLTVALTVVAVSVVGAFALRRILGTSPS